jgi:YegS/Rv2252/BmrU family lipid kinase
MAIVVLIGVMLSASVEAHQPHQPALSYASRVPAAVRRSLLAAGLACLVLCAVLGLVVRHHVFGLDAHVVHVDHGNGYGFLRGVEIAFRPILVLGYALVASLLLLRRHLRACVYVFGAVFVAQALHRLLAWAFDRPRPSWQVAAHAVSSGSYPSGHVTAIAALAGALAVVARMLVRRRHLRRLYYTLLAAAVALVAVDRVLLGRHYVTDVVGGLLLGLGVVVAGMAVYSPLPRSIALIAPLPLLDSAPRGSKLAVVLNPIKVESVRSFKSVVSQLARESGWDEPDWYYTTVDDSGTGMAAAAAAKGADLVLVCGGDGTVREVCAELAGTGIAVGIIPAGTGNLLARNLQIPLYLRAAIDVALNGQDKAVDLVEVSGDGMEDTHFLVMAGMGFDAAIMEGVDEDLKKRIGWFAYVISGAKALMFPAVRLEISIDGAEPTRHRARTIVVGNVGTLTGGMPLLPDARIDDGLLDVVLLYPQRFWSWLPLAWRILTRRPHTDSLVNRMRGSEVVVRADRDTPRELDGDTLGSGREMRMRCIHGRLLVRVPRYR